MILTKFLPLILFTVLIAAAAVFLYKKHAAKKGVCIVLAAAWALFTAAFFFVSVYRFSAPEKALAVYQPSATYLAAVEGEDAVLALSAGSPDKLSVTLLQKDGDKVYYGLTSAAKRLYRAATAKGVATVYRATGTKTCFCVVTGFDSAPLTVFDTLGSTFEKLDRAQGAPVYVAVLSGFDDSYAVTLE